MNGLELGRIEITKLLRNVIEAVDARTECAELPIKANSGLFAEYEFYQLVTDIPRAIYSCFISSVLTGSMLYHAAVHSFEFPIFGQIFSVSLLQMRILSRMTTSSK